MFPDTSHRLIQCICSSMLVVRALEEMFMKYNERLLCRILRTMQIPVVTGVPAPNRDISIIHQNDIEVPRINLL